jgi:hypothetical protein
MGLYKEMLKSPFQFIPTVLVVLLFYMLLSKSSRHYKVGDYHYFYVSENTALDQHLSIMQSENWHEPLLKRKGLKDRVIEIENMKTGEVRTVQLSPEYIVQK